MTAVERDVLIQKIVAALRADEGVAAAWLSGSIGRGSDDEWSDVDVLALVQGRSAAETGLAYAADTAAITETVYRQALYGGLVVNCITPGWQRFDLTFVDAAQLARYNPRDLKPLFNTGTAEPGQAATAAVPAARERVLRSTHEFIRILGLLPVGLGREEYVNGLIGLGYMRSALIDLMIEENGIAPPDRGGALHLNRLLTPTQRIALEALPAVAASRESIIAANSALAALFWPLARTLCARLGAEWPEAFETATQRHLERWVGGVTWG